MQEHFIHVAMLLRCLYVCLCEKCVVAAPYWCPRMPAEELLRTTTILHVSNLTKIYQTSWASVTARTARSVWG